MQTTLSAIHTERMNVCFLYTHCVWTLLGHITECVDTIRTPLRVWTLLGHR